MKVNMKLLFSLLITLFSFCAIAQKPQKGDEMTLRLAAYRTKMEKITNDMKATAAQYCEKKVEIACKMQNGGKATPEESYDAKEIAHFKAAEQKVLTCKNDQLCKVKTSRQEMKVAINGFGEKCKKGDNKYCFNHKIFQSIDAGTALMEEEASWLAKNGKK